MSSPRTPGSRRRLVRLVVITALLPVALTAELVPAAAATTPTTTAASSTAVTGAVTPGVAPRAQVGTYTWWQYLCNRSRYRLPRLGYGSRGYAVSVLQLSLKRMGFYTKRVDGSFGPVTYRAVRNFQRAVRIVVDGRVGPQTWGAVQRSMCD
jgi:peptidoglycan hydrolase-like protein with peptidoglycan-binding domain